MVVSDAAALVIFGLAATAGVLLGLGSHLRWDRVLERLHGRLLRPVRPAPVAPDASRREAPDLALGEGAR